jgi:paraquat-inducible protein A
MRECHELMACEECDALYTRVDLQPGEAVCCSRCGARLEKEEASGFFKMLPLTLACLVLFVVANIFPIVEIEMQGMRSHATLLHAVHILYVEGRAFVAALVLLTTFLLPLGQLMILFYLLWPLRAGSGRPYFAGLLRFMQMLRPWGMIEVFLLGVLVALVKLSNMVTVIPDIALFAFGALTILLVIVVSFNLRYFWEMYMDRDQDQARAGESA